MNLPKNTARIMRDLANVIEEALKKALRKFKQWRKAAAKPKL